MFVSIILTIHQRAPRRKDDACREIVIVEQFESYYLVRKFVNPNLLSRNYENLGPGETT